MAAEPLLAGKRVVVTGGGRGIGRAIGEACAREGAKVVLAYLASGDGAREAVASIGREGGQAEALPLDVTDVSAVAAAVDRIAAAGPIAGWVNNAGVNLPDLLATADPERVRRTVEVNLLGTLWCCRAVLPVMMRQRSGVIVNVGSAAARRPSRGQAAYAATKGALESLTAALAVEYGRKGIRVHCLRPGPIATDMLAPTQALAAEEVERRLLVGRVGAPADVAAMAVVLLSDVASFATGGVVDVDGGFALS